MTLAILGQKQARSDPGLPATIQPARLRRTKFTGAIMKVRNIMAGLAVTTLVLGSASAALARGHHGYMAGGYHGGCNGDCYYGYAGGYAPLSPEEQQAAEKLIREHAAAVEPLRTQLDAKRLELDALSRNPNAKPEAISKLAEEVAGLSAQLRKAGADFRARLSSEAGIRPAPRNMGPGAYRHGYHHGMMGWDD